MVSVDFIYKKAGERNHTTHVKHSKHAHTNALRVSFIHALFDPTFTKENS